MFCSEAASGGVWRARRREGGARGRQAEETVNTERINLASEYSQPKNIQTDLEPRLYPCNSAFINTEEHHSVIPFI